MLRSLRNVLRVMLWPRGSRAMMQCFSAFIRLASQSSGGACGMPQSTHKHRNVRVSAILFRSSVNASSQGKMRSPCLLYGGLPEKLQHSSYTRRALHCMSDYVGQAPPICPAGGLGWETIAPWACRKGRLFFCRLCARFDIE